MCLETDWDQVLTRLEDQQVQGVVSQVGGGGELVRWDPHQQLLVVAPGEQQAAGGQTQDTVLIDAGPRRQHLQLLHINTDYRLLIRKH